jgi:hypothetical protein
MNEKHCNTSRALKIGLKIVANKFIFGAGSNKIVRKVGQNQNLFNFAFDGRKMIFILKGRPTIVIMKMI